MITYIAEPNYSPRAISLYKNIGRVYFRFTSKADIIVVRLAITVDKQLIDSMPNLKVIATSTTGLNHIDTTYAEKKGIKIVSLRGETSFLKNIPSTAEETFGLIIALVRNLPWAFDDVKRGNWRTNRWVGHQLLGKTLGIVGFGRLGRIMASYGKTFGMNVIVADPYVKVKKVLLKSLLKTSDIVSLHVTLNGETRDMIRETHFRMMKPTAYFLNTARAELVEEGALETALEKKWIAGAAVDVMRNEREDGRHLKHSRLLAYAKKHHNLIIVPHIGGTTYDAMRVTQDFIAEKVCKML